MSELWAEKKGTGIAIRDFQLPTPKEAPFGVWRWKILGTRLPALLNSNTVVRELLFLSMDSPIYWINHNNKNSVICMMIILYYSIAKAH